ncbi:hypothetical protein ACF05L_38065 [Streptomyces bobili]|uniref:hypothetical protein n=1 Tax=Streptomyces bobili TaxID=67280 RepID=UPI0036F6E91F
MRKMTEQRLTPVWFLLHGDDIVLTAEKIGFKSRSLTRYGQFTLRADEDRLP